MKTINFLTIFTSLLISIHLFQACSSSDDPQKESEEQVFLKALEGEWKISGATYDGLDVTKSFPGLIISIIDDQRILAENPVPPIWVGASSFTLEPSGNTFKINRSDGMEIMVTSQNQQKLVLSFTYDASKLTGRVKGVVGDFSFEFIK